MNITKSFPQSSPEGLERLEKEIGVYFVDKSLLLLALTHRSYRNEDREYGRSNERLEFFGDAIIEMIVTEHLYNELPEEPEGRLTTLRNILVQGKTLSEIANRLSLGDYLRMSRGQAKLGHKPTAKLLSDAYEALVGAVYIDQGYEVAKRFVNQTVLMELDYVLSENPLSNSSGMLQEVTQVLFGITPTYAVLSEEGLDHDKRFVTGAYLDSVLIGKGDGSSKAEARADAAVNALENQAAWENHPDLPKLRRGTL